MSIQPLLMTFLIILDVCSCYGCVQYKIRLDPNHVTRAEGKALCEDQGGDIAVINSESSMDEALKAMARSGQAKEAWIGLKQIDNDVMRWENGDVFSLSVSTLHKQGTEKCAMLRDLGRIETASCTKRKATLCMTYDEVSLRLFNSSRWRDWTMDHSAPPYFSLQHDPPPSYDEVMYGVAPTPPTRRVANSQTSISSSQVLASSQPIRDQTPVSRRAQNLSAQTSGIRSKSSASPAHTPILRRTPASPRMSPAQGRVPPHNAMYPSGIPPVPPVLPPPLSGVPPISRGLPPLSPGLPPSSPGIPPTSPGLRSTSPGLSPTSPGLPPTSPRLLPTSPRQPSTSGSTPTSPGFPPVPPTLPPVPPIRAPSSLPIRTPSPLPERPDVYLCRSPSTAVQDAARYTASMTQGGGFSPVMYCSEDSHMRYPDDLLITQHVGGGPRRRCRSGQGPSPVLTKLLIIGGVLTVLMVSAAIVVGIVTRDPEREQIITNTLHSSASEDRDWDYLGSLRSTPDP